MFTDKTKWFLLVAMSAALALIFINQTSIAVALPSIARELNLSYSKEQWVINIYALLLASCLILGGRLGDVFGHCKIFLVGIFLFCLSSLICGFVHNIDSLLAARAVQGVAAALMIPAASVIVVSSFPETERGRAVGIYVGLASIFLSLGPFIGGYITETFSWRWVFFINIPVGFIGFTLAIFTVPKLKAKKHKVLTDYPGFIMLLCTIVPLVFGITESIDHGLVSWYTFGFLLFSLFSFFVFIWVEQRAAAPLVDLSLFRNKTLSTCLIILFQDQAVIASMVFWMLFLQYAVALPPMTSGLLLVTATLPIMAAAPLAGYLRDLYGSILIIRIGSVLMGMGALWIGITCYKMIGVWLIPGFVLFGIGTPFVLTPSFATALSSVSFAQRGLTSGIISTGKQVGLTLGLAVIGAIIGHYYHFQMKAYLASHSAYQHLQPSDIDGVVSGLERSRVVIEHLPLELKQSLLTEAKAAFVHSFSAGMIFVALIILTTFCWTWRIPKPGHQVSESSE